MKVVEPALIEDLPLLNNMNKATFGTTGNENFGSFGQDPPPPSTGGELGDEKCYTAKRTDTLVLRRDAGFVDIRQPCRWQIESYSQLKMLTAIEMEGACTSDYQCVTHTYKTLEIDVRESDGGHMTACELLDNIDSDFELVIILRTDYKGCIKEITKLMGQSPGDVGAILENIGQDFECHLLGGEAGREDLFKKVLECLCKIEQEPDPEKQEDMFKEMNDKIAACAKKYNKKMVDTPEGRKRAEDLLANATPPIYPDDYNPFGPRAWPSPATPDYSGESDEWISDQLSNLYERCLKNIEKLC